MSDQILVMLGSKGVKPARSASDVDRYFRLVQAVDFGKILPDAVYVHRSGLRRLPAALLAMLELAIEEHAIPNGQWTLCKLFKRELRVSFLVYPHFTTNPYPPLQASYLVDLARGSCRHTDFSRSVNPPILHRRESFLPPDHPHRAAFYAFTSEGEAAGLYENTSRIGFKKQWERLIREKGYQLIDGHLVPLETAVSESTPEATRPRTHDQVRVERHRTAIDRHRLSAPFGILARHGYLGGEHSVLDYGCGKGDDVRELQARGIDAHGWDPVYRPEGLKYPRDLVNLGFVLNVIDDRAERDAALHEAYALTCHVLAVSVMLGGPALRAQYKAYGDGVITAWNTFQKYYSQSELRAYIETTLKASAVAAAPGIFLVFKDELEEQRFLLRRHTVRRDWHQVTARKPRAPTGLAAHTLVAREPDLFKAFWQACLDLGRVPASSEFEHSDAVSRVAGSRAKAHRALTEVYGCEPFERARDARRDDLLVYFALSFFGDRKAYRRMPKGLRRDIREFFGHYDYALTQARELLFGIARTDLIVETGVAAHRTLGCGVMNDGHSLVVHRRYIDELPPLLRVYVGAAAQLFGDIDAADLIKVHFTSAKVSLLFYDDFEAHPQPQLLRRVKVRLRDQDFDDFDHSEDPSGRLEDKQRYLRDGAL